MAEMENNQFLSGGVMLGALGVGLNYLKSIPVWIWRRIKRKITFKLRVEQTTDLYKHLNRYLVDKYPNRLRTVNASYDNSNNVKTSGPTPEDKEVMNSINKLNLEQLEDEFIIWKGLLPIYVSKGREKMENASYAVNLFFDKFTLSGIFAKRRILKFIDEVIEYNKQFEVEENQIKIYDYSAGYGWNNVNNITPKTIDNIFLEGGVKESLIEDCNKFIENREWYIERGIPYKRGYLLKGPPGNGKTSICLALSNELKRNIYFLGLNKLTDKALKEAFSDLSHNSILILEDIDAAFSKRSGKSKLSFSAILNCLDGVFFKEGVITIMTTNHPEKLDPALVRPGRVDMSIHLGNPSKDVASRYLSRFYNEEIIIDKQPKLSMAAIQGLCIEESSPQSVISRIYECNEKNSEQANKTDNQ